MDRIAHRVAAFVMGLGGLAHACAALAVLTGGTSLNPAFAARPEGSGPPKAVSDRQAGSGTEGRPAAPMARPASSQCSTGAWPFAPPAIDQTRFAAGVSSSVAVSVATAVPFSSTANGPASVMTGAASEAQKAADFVLPAPARSEAAAA